MKRHALMVCSVFFATATATAALAADLPRKAPIYSPSYSGVNWTGAYAGINGGYGWGNASISDPSFTTFGARATGWLGGGTLGYNMQTGSWVWGVEGDVDYSTIKATNTTDCKTSGCEFRNSWLGTGRGRIGYAFDRFLVYGTGGAAFGDMKFTRPSGGGSNTKSESTTKLGWTVGGGVEYALMGAWSVKAEYLYVDLGNFSCSPATCGSSTTIKMPLNIARLGVNYRF
jgi:outer membrane immunogenic protein